MHSGALQPAAAPVRKDPLCAPLQALGSHALRHPCRGPATVLAKLTGTRPALAGKCQASWRHAPATRRAARGAGRGRGQRGGAGRAGGAACGTGSAGRPEPSQGAPRGEDSGRCRHPAGERERERERGPPARRPGQCGPVREGAGGRVSKTQSAAATTKRTCWSPAPPSPPFPYSPNGTEKGPATPPPLPLPRPPVPPPRRLAAASSCRASSFAARRLPPPLSPGRFPGPAPPRREVYVTGGPGAAAAAARTWTPSTPSTRR